MVTRRSEKAVSHVTKILMFGVTGRMGRRRHLEGALLTLAAAGESLDIAVVGRDGQAPTALADEYGLRVHSTLERALSEESWDLYFDAGRPVGRVERLTAAMSSGCSVYSEKPVALSPSEMRELLTVATQTGVQTFVVTDKLFTPGYRALREVLEREVLGEVCDVRGEFGYFIDTGLDGSKPQRPSWNYRKDAGGSLFPDLYSHWTYMLEMISSIASVQAVSTTHVARRRDEQGEEFVVDVPDTAHVIGKLSSGATLSLSTSWIYRPMVPFTMRVYGLSASAEVTPTSCLVHHANGATSDAVNAFGVTADDEFLLQWRGIIAQLASGQGRMPSFTDALRQALVCEALEKSTNMSTLFDVPQS